MSGFWRCVAYAVVLALAAHPLGQALPRRFHPERPPFRPWKWEKNGRIYSRLGIEKWKKLVPDMSRLLPDMVKKELPGSGAVTAAVFLPVHALVRLLHRWDVISAPVFHFHGRKW